MSAGRGDKSPPRLTGRWLSPAKPEGPNEAPKPPPRPNPMRGAGFWIVLAVLFVANYLIAQQFLGPHEPTRVEVSFSEFKRAVAADNVTSVTAKGDVINGHTRAPLKGTLNGDP